jgi:hypothetical protein
VGSFRHSAKLTEALKKAQIEMGLKQLKLIQDVKTRWNSTVDLLISLVTNHAPISAIAADPSNSGLRKNLPDEHDISLMYDLIHLLEPLKDLTVGLSGYKYNTISSLLPAVHFLINQEIGLLEIRDALTEQARECLHDSLVTRFDY